MAPGIRIPFEDMIILPAGALSCMGWVMCCEVTMGLIWAIDVTTWGFRLVLINKGCDNGTVLGGVRFPTAFEFSGFNASVVLNGVTIAGLDEDKAAPTTPTGK